MTRSTIISVAVAAALAGPMAAFAGTTVYGNFRYTFHNVEVGAAGSNVTASNNASRLGVKGSYGDDIKGIFNLQMGANNDNADATIGGSALSARFFFAGLKGSFGTVKYGRLSHAY